MYAVIATTLALTGAAVAAPAATIKARAEQFGLHAFSTGGELQYWAVVNAHIGAGQNALQIQRPAAYQSDPAYLNNTELFFGKTSSPYPPFFSLFSLPATKPILANNKILSRPRDRVPLGCRHPRGARRHRGPGHVEARRWCRRHRIRCCGREADLQRLA